jgi:hypothetical protein
MAIHGVIPIKKLSMFLFMHHDLSQKTSTTTNFLFMHVSGNFRNSIRLTEKE